MRGACASTRNAMKSFILSTIGHLCQLTVAYGVPIAVLYAMNEKGLDHLMLLAVPLMLIWVFVTWWLTRHWSRWGETADDTSATMSGGRRWKFDPEAAVARLAGEEMADTPTVRLNRAEIGRPPLKPRGRRILIVSLLMLASAIATVAYYEFNYSYERCILRNMPGVPPNAASLIQESCRQLSW